MKKLFLMGACLLALGSTPVLAQTGERDVVVVRLYNGSPGRMIIAREGGKTEVLEYHTGVGKKSNQEAATEVQQVMSSLYREGYELKSTFSEEPIRMSTLLFVKPK